MAKKTCDGLPRSRKEAMRKGSSRYYTGRPCIHGHVSQRTAVSGNCVECLITVHAEAKRDYNNSQKARESHNQWHNSVNDKTREKASNSRQKWLDYEIDIAMKKSDEMSYVYTAKEAAFMLRRSYRAIERIRQRYSG